MGYGDRVENLDVLVRPLDSFVWRNFRLRRDADAERDFGCATMNGNPAENLLPPLGRSHYAAVRRGMEGRRRQETYSDTRNLRVNGWAFLCSPNSEEEEREEREDIRERRIHSIRRMWLRIRT